LESIKKEWSAGIVRAVPMNAADEIVCHANMKGAARTAGKKVYIILTHALEHAEAGWPGQVGHDG